AKISINFAKGELIEYTITLKPKILQIKKELRNMSVSTVPITQFSVSKASQINGTFNLNKPTSRCRHKGTVIRCCDKSTVARSSPTNKNYYELLGVSVDSSGQHIKEAYRKLQKKYHPDIAGQEGHEHTLMLNEAYKVLIREDLRRDYDASIGQMGMQFGRNTSGLGYSSWKGPLRPQALYVDETACIGCRECVHHAGNTFVFDDALGSARVKVQYGDDDQNIEVSVDSCPVNCIHLVDREDLRVLEFLNQPQPKKGYGIFGNGWERPKNVFLAAKAFDKHLKQQETVRHHQKNARTYVEEETPAQAEARVNASMKIKMKQFSFMWNVLREIFGSKHVH
ncbi:DnaJ domain-containing protein/Fer4_15 domain-containing protein, partial [Cephalotus follicularis]